MVPLIRQEVFFIQLHLYNLSAAILIVAAALLGQVEKLNKVWAWDSKGYNIKNIALFSTIASMILVILSLYYTHFTRGNAADIAFSMWRGQLPLAANDLSLLFLAVVAVLMPAVVILADIDINPRGQKYLVILLSVYLVATLLILCTDILIFYVLYELLIFLVFIVMYLSTNARGCVEASLFFLG